MLSAFDHASTSTPQSAFANNGNGFGMFATNTAQKQTSFFASPAAQPPSATPSSLLATPASAFAAQSQSPSPPPSSAIPPLTSAFSTPPATSSPPLLTSASSNSGARPPSHLIAPKPPGTSPQTNSKLSANAPPFQPTGSSRANNAPAFSHLPTLVEAEEWQEGDGDDGGMYGEEEGEEGGEVAEEEAEIQRLENARSKRQQRFNHFAQPSIPQSIATSSHTATSAAKLAVARAAGMALADDEDAIVDDGDELVVATAETRIKGQCTTMCTRKEVLDRLESHTISVLEVEEGQSPSSLSPTAAVPLAVKKYRRAAAAQQLDPRDVRTPATLLATCQHLVDRLVDRGDVEWHEVHRFVTDRFRAVRSDYVCQGVVSADTVQCLEWMVRFHIVAMDVLRAEPTETFDPIQNMEKLTQTLTSLRLLYRDNSASSNPFPTPCEAEMQGYLLFTQFNRNFFSSYTSLSSALQSSAPVQYALSTYNAMRENNYALFFSLLRRASYLQLCLCLPFVGRVRERALRTVCRAYQRFSVSALTEVLCMDDDDRAVAMLRWYGVSVAAGMDEIVFVSGGSSKSGRRQQFVPNANGAYAEDNAERLVSSKRPATKRLAIRATLEAADRGAGLSASASVAVARRPVAKERGAKPVGSSFAASKLPPSTFAPSLSSFPAQTPLPPATSVPTTTTSISSQPVRLRQDTTVPFPSFTAAQSHAVTAPPPLISSTFDSAPPRTSPRHTTSTAFPTAPPALPAASAGPSFQSQPFAFAQSSPRQPASSTPALPASVSSFTIPRSSPSFPTPNAVFIPPASTARAPPSLASPTSTSTLPLLRSLSSQQRDERLQREVAQSLLRQQQQLERERTAAQLQLASQLHVALLLRRWQRSVQERRAARAERERRVMAAWRWHRQGMLLGCLLQWHGLWREREERRENDAAMRRAMGEDQHGLSAVHAGLMTMEERLRQLYGERASSTLRTDSTNAADLDGDDLPVYEDDDEAGVDTSGPVWSSTSIPGLDVAALVAEETAARNPTQSELFFHLLVSVGTEQSAYSQLLLNKLSHNTSVAGERLATPRRADRLLLLPSHEPSDSAPPLLSYTVPVPRSAPARQLHLRVQREEEGSAPPSRHVGYQGAVFLLSSAVGLEDVPSVVSHPDPHSPLPSTASSFIVPPASRFEHDRQRLETFIATLHRHSALPLVILYPLAPSALSYMQHYGTASSAYFQQHAALMMMHCLRLTNVDARVVADVSVSPLFLPVTLFSPSFTASSDAPLFGYNDDCLRAAVTHLAASSLPHPVLHRIDVPDTIEQRLQLCTGYLDQLVSHFSIVLTSAASSSNSMAAGLSSVLSMFSPQLYVDHFNACVQSFKRRLFTVGVKELSWPPEGSGLSLSASPSSTAAQNVRQLLAVLPLPSFPSSSSSTPVLDWSWPDCHSAAVAYLTSYRTLLSLTARVNADDDEQQSAIDSDLYTLHRKAYDAFATATPAHTADDGATPRSVQEATAYDRLTKLSAWHGWLLALLEHRLVSELTMHPLMLDAQQHLYSLLSADALIEHHETDTHSHVLPPAINAMEVGGEEASSQAEVSGKRPNGVASSQLEVVKRRKLDAHTNGSAEKQKAETRNDRRADDASQALVPLAAVTREPATHKDGLWLALEEEKRRQSRLNAMLDEMEASLNQ